MAEQWPEPYETYRGLSEAVTILHNVPTHRPGGRYDSDYPKITKVIDILSKQIADYAQRTGIFNNPEDLEAMQDAALAIADEERHEPQEEALIE